jgi:glycosyltransferase involved in cell wall biosynthesis
MHQMKRIRIGWFAHTLVGREASGTGTVARNIAKTLIEKNRSEIETTLISKNSETRNLLLRDEVFSKINIVDLEPVRGSRLKFSRQYFFASRNKKLSDTNLDFLIFTVPRFFPYFWKFPSKKFICIFHAAGDITVKPDFFAVSRVIYNFIARNQWKKLSGIIAVSDRAKKEISLHYHIPEEYISVMLPGADHLWDVKEKFPRNLTFSEHEKIILIMGRWQEFKNMHSMLNSIVNNLEFYKSFKFVFLGKSNSVKSNFLKQDFSKLPRTMFISYDFLDDSELAWLYRNSYLVVHPSVNEGFGLPAFEAFAEGCRLLVHEGTPAADYLKKFDNVTVANLSDSSSILRAITSAVNSNTIPADKARRYLNSINAEWGLAANSFLKIVDKSQG